VKELYKGAIRRRDTLTERNPPPGGGFLFTMFPDQEPCVRDFTTRYYTRVLIRENSKKETPPGGGVSFDQLAIQYNSVVWSEGGI